MVDARVGKRIPASVFCYLDGWDQEEEEPTIIGDQTVLVLEPCAVGGPSPVFLSVRDLEADDIVTIVPLDTDRLVQVGGAVSGGTRVPGSYEVGGGTPMRQPVSGPAEEGS